MLIIVEHDDHYDYHDHGEEEEWESLEQQLLLVVAEHREPSPPSQGWQSWCWWQVTWSSWWWSQWRWRRYPWDYLATDIDAALCFYPEFMNQLRIFLNNILTVSWNQDSETGEKYFTCNYFSPAFIFHLHILRWSAFLPRQSCQPSERKPSFNKFDWSSTFSPHFTKNYFYLIFSWNSIPWMIDQLNWFVNIQISKKQLQGNLLGCTLVLWLEDMRPTNHLHPPCVSFAKPTTDWCIYTTPT